MLATDPVGQWVDRMLATAPSPTPEQTDLLRRVFRSNPQTTGTSSPVPDAA